ncbi:chorismate mutase, partial [Microvirga sp. 3-52]|nr:chorismate mutase [Microvirga sp. 3-52]
MLNFLKEYNQGPLPNGVMDQIFKGIFMSALEIQEDEQRNALLVSRKRKAEDTIVNVNGVAIGNGSPSFIFGPCAVESYEQVLAVALA